LELCIINVIIIKLLIILIIFYKFQVQLRIRILQKVSEPYGPGSITLTATPTVQ
jgi:hypothetical protein